MYLSHKICWYDIQPKLTKTNFKHNILASNSSSQSRFQKKKKTIIGEETMTEKKEIQLLENRSGKGLTALELGSSTRDQDLFGLEFWDLLIIFCVKNHRKIPRVLHQWYSGTTQAPRPSGLLSAPMNTRITSAAVTMSSHFCSWPEPEPGWGGVT